MHTYAQNPSHIHTHPDIHQNHLIYPYQRQHRPNMDPSGKILQKRVTQPRKRAKDAGRQDERE